MANYAIGMDDAELVKVCLECRRPSCDEGLCPRYRIAWEQHSDKIERKTGPRAKPHEVNGVAHTVKEWAEISGIPLKTLKDRIYMQKLTMEEALARPVKGVKA